MPLGQSTAPGDELGAAMAVLTELWRTVGYDSVDDQPRKRPTPTEADQLRDLLGRALTALNGA